MTEDKQATPVVGPPWAAGRFFRYGRMASIFKQVVTRIASAAIVTASLAFSQSAASGETRGDIVRIVAFGDSLTAGYNLSAEEAFPARLERALKGLGHAVEVINAGVSGDTTAGALARLDWAVPADADAVIVEFGANDALRGIAPSETGANLERIVTMLMERGQQVLIAGMLAPPNMGDDYEAAFNAIYPDLANERDALLYPFFLDGVAAEPRLNQGDGMHPTAAGVDVIVERILPKVIELIDRVEAARRKAS